MSINQNDNIEDLIVKSLAGETSGDEEMQLADWLEQNQSNQKLFAQFKHAFKQGTIFYAPANDVPFLNVDKEWSRFVDSIPEQIIQKNNVRLLVKEKSTSTSWMRIAAAVLLLIVSGFVVNYFVSGSHDVVYQTAENTLPVTLPDGSQVILNINSRLSYSTSFGESRRAVTLQGEAFFEVAHNANKPFVITANATEVEVLGTSFNVMAYDNEKEISVIVQTGKVKLSVAQTKEEIILLPGERGVFSKDNNQLSSAVNSDPNFLSWQTRKLVFIEKDLKSVIEIINKTYNSDIRIATKISETCVVTVTFEGQSLEAVLNVLKSTLNLTYQNKDGHIEIISAGC